MEVDIGKVLAAAQTTMGAQLMEIIKGQVAIESLNAQITELEAKLNGAGIK